MDETYDQPVYFIGIALPEALDRQISDIMWNLYEHDKSLLKPLLPHVTLLHPPSLKGIMPEELLPKIQAVAEKYLPLTIACQEIGFFGKNVAFIRVQSQGLYSLQAQLVKLLPPEAWELHYKRPYMPHITLAQAYEPHELDTDALLRELPKKLDLPKQFSVDSVSYFKRILPRQYRAKSI
jgi:2'-5' RNA ligase